MLHRLVEPTGINERIRWASLTDYLSGIPIGHELISSPLQPPVLIVGEPTLCALYERALTHFGVKAEVISADVATTGELYSIGKLVERNRGMFHDEKAPPSSYDYG